MFRSIADYGLIGDIHSLALVSKDGSIDYCSLPWLDSPTIFASLLDDEKGGYFSLQPSVPFSSVQEYLTDTNILTCRFTTQNAEALLYDFMPVENPDQSGEKYRRIHRCLKVIRGSMNLTLTLQPRPDYGKVVPAITETTDNRYAIQFGDENLTLYVACKNSSLISNASGVLMLALQLDDHEEAHIDLLYGSIEQAGSQPCPFEYNQLYWQEWVNHCMGERCDYFGEFRPMIHRSLLALKLLTFQPTGAIAAAATTSLPETLGGERNWDYRFSWLRDASFTLKALFSVGHIAEADVYLRWLHLTYRKYGSHDLQIMYTLQGSNQLMETELSHLKGYYNSRPVRIGNGAHNQSQWDIYGEVMDSALRLSDYAGKIDDELWPFFREICTLAIENWQKPDDGIWEVRNGPHHFVYSKVMCWVALDRGISIANRYGFDAPLEYWKKERELIKQDILAKGFNQSMNSFVQKYGSDDLDASLLLLPLAGFLPVEDRRIQGTIEACQNQLMHNGFMLRYLSADGLSGTEGGFILCNFWLVECLALSGKLKEASELLHETVTASNHLGLFSEEFDSTTHEMLGNFPQAFSHIGFINAVSAIIALHPELTQAVEETSWSDRFRKLIPLQVILNKTEKTPIESSKEIGAQLKQTLGKLQGAFFNTKRKVVNYDAMKKSAEFNHYIQLAQLLNNFKPETLKGDDEKKAFWINIYNILIIHGVIEFNVRNSVHEIINFFGRISYNIGGYIFSADDIEHGILRKNRSQPYIPFKPFSDSDPRKILMVESFDPRIHFALVCAASSCPPVEFYEAALIDRQLHLSGKSFINRGGVEIDRMSGTLWLSAIFDWYSSDFGHSNRDIVLSLLPYMTGDNKEWLEQNLSTLSIRYRPYNWNLNSVLE
jgi:GH15 family glucan-1,4-alpha-glucosidase